MIRNSKQQWEIGQKVRVGFMSLTVRLVVNGGYVLTNHAGDKLYAFVPHNGLSRIDAAEARAAIETHQRHAERLAQRAIAHAQRVDAFDALFA